MQLTRTAADRLQIGTLEVVHVAQDESMVRERNDGGNGTQTEPRDHIIYSFWGHPAALHGASGLRERVPCIRSRGPFIGAPSPKQKPKVIPLLPTKWRKVTCLEAAQSGSDTKQRISFPLPLCQLILHLPPKRRPQSNWRLS